MLSWNIMHTISSHESTVAVEKQYVIRTCTFVCVCSLSYPAMNVHEPYCHLWVVLAPQWEEHKAKQNDAL
jgi:hypothetical protein